MTKHELREWFFNNYDKCNEIWVSIKFGEPKNDNNLYYLDAVEIALCFGWIDTTKKKYNDEITIQKFMPRKCKSNWTELNKERCRRLVKLGLMHESGLKLCKPFLNEKFSIDIMKKIKNDIDIYNNFIKMLELYIRIKIDNIQSYKKDIPTYNLRLKKIFRINQKNKIYGLWNDYGRLLKYE